MFKKALFFLTIFAVFGHANSSANANTMLDGRIAIEAFSGKVLYSHNADELCYPASLTKMMTLYLLFDEFEAGRLSLNSRLKVSSTAAAAPPSKLGLKAGQTITAKDAMYALITKSANDVAITIAENIAGSEPAFAKKMTQKAQQLGMSKTVFRNASGLPNSQQVTTPRDMAMLGRSLLLHHNKYYHYFSTPSYSYKNITYKNHNKLLKDYEGVDGIKTGYINASGFNLVASARRGDQRIIATVVGGKTSQIRNDTMEKLLNEGFNRLQQVRPTWVKLEARPRSFGSITTANAESAEIDPDIRSIIYSTKNTLPDILPERPAHLNVKAISVDTVLAQNNIYGDNANKTLEQVVSEDPTITDTGVFASASVAEPPKDPQETLKESVFEILNVQDGRYAVILTPELSLEKAKQTGTDTQRTIERIIDYSKVQIAYTEGKYYTPIINNLWGQDAITACQLILVRGYSCSIKEKNVS